MFRYRMLLRCLVVVTAIAVVIVETLVGWFPLIWRIATAFLILVLASIGMATFGREMHWILAIALFGFVPAGILVAIFVSAMPWNRR